MTERLKVLEELEGEFARVARNDRRGARRRRGSRRTLALALIATITASAGALAASGILTGEPVQQRAGEAPKPDEGLGVARDASATLTPLRVSDPDGGPDWGLRTLTTSRGLGCVQVGRLVDGRLGVLGQDGAFGNDRRFHPLPPKVLDQSFCRNPDGAGNTFIAVSYQGLPASADGTACRPPDKGEPLRPAASPPDCPREDLRILYFGVLGPEGKNVRYTDGDGTRRTSEAVGPGGAYLVVVRPRPGRRVTGQWVASATPRSGLRSVQYRDGSVCRIPDPRALGGANACPVKGYAAPKRAKVKPRQLQTEVRASVTLGPPPAGIGAQPPDEYKVTVRFRAPVSADAKRYYVVSYEPEKGSTCDFSGIESPVSRDVRAGEEVVATQYPACQGRLRVAVRFHQPRSAKEDDQLPFAPRSGRDPEIGAATVELPQP